MRFFSGGIQEFNRSICFLTLLVSFFSFALTTESEAQEPTALRLTLSPLAPAGEECAEHGQAGPPLRGKGEGVSRPALESEHRPKPVRTYHFNEHRRLADVKAYIRRPDGTVVEPEDLRLGINPTITFKTPLGDGPNHGAHNVYIVEQGVEGDVLVVRVAKWITMHHSCGWGHDQKFNKLLTQPQPLDSIPLEILISDLWDDNFHSRVDTGEKLRITVLRSGKPVSGAQLKLKTEQDWYKETRTNKDGSASIQLIRDYYPKSWKDFHRTHRGEFLVTATYDVKEQGVYKGAPYERVHYIATHPWNYAPSSRDYASYSFGLLIAVTSMVITGGGIFLYRERRKKPYQGIVFDE